MVPSQPKRITAALLSTLIFAHNVVLTHAMETNFLPKLPEPIGLLRHSRESGNPVFNFSQNQVKNLGPRLRGGDVSIPYQYGQLRKVLKPIGASNGRTVLTIQDIHQNTEAQTNIAHAIDSLISNSKISLIALEGSAEPVPLKSFRDFPKPVIVHKVADYLLSQNRISGPVYAGLTSAVPPPPLAGVDDAFLHSQNVQAYKESIRGLSEARVATRKWADKIETEKNATFNKGLLAFDQAVQRLRTGQVSLGDHIELLASSLPQIEPHFEAFLEALKIESSLSFPKIESERARLIDQLLKKMTDREQSSLVQLSSAYRLGSLSHSDFYSYLSDLCRRHDVPLSKFPNMSDYIQYVLLTDSIDAERLLRVINQHQKEIYASLTKSDREKALLQESNQAYLTGKLIEFSLTNDEWQEYKGVRSPKSALLPFEKFYELAESRDEAISKNLISLIEKNHSSNSIVVTGGFHSDGIGQRLSNLGYTVLVFTPKLTKVDSAEGSSYLSVFTQEKAPLDQLFKGEKLFLANKGDAGLIDLPLIGAAVQKIAEPTSDAQKAFEQLAPKARFDGISVEIKPNLSAEATLDKGSHRVEADIQVDNQLNLKKVSIRIVTNVHVLSALLSVLPLSWSDQVVGPLFWAAAVGFFLAYEALLFFFAFAHEYTEAFVQGHFLHKNSSEIFWEALNAFIHSSSQLPFVHHKNNLTHPTQVRLTAMSGLSINLILAIIGGVEASHGSLFGLMLGSSNAVLFILTLAFGQDRQAILKGAVQAYTCGIWGYIGKIPKNDIAKKSEHMGFFTKIRGYQSGGWKKKYVMPEHNNIYGWMFLNPHYAFLYFILKLTGWVSFPTVADLHAEGIFEGEDHPLVTDPHYRVTHLTLKLVNTKRGDLIEKLLIGSGWVEKIALLKGFQPIEDQEDSGFHTRFATGSLTRLKEAHPHVFKEPRLEKVYRFENKILKSGWIVVSNCIFHNGDFNGLQSAHWKMFEQKKGKVEVSRWLQKVLNTTDTTKGDSPKIAGMMDLLITQGMWFASARLAYQMAVAQSIDEEAPSELDLATLARLFENSFEDHKEQLFPTGSTSLEQINKQAVDDFLGDVIDKLAKAVISQSWTDEHRKDFAEMALQAFLYNDPKQAIKLLFALAAPGSTFGLNVSSSLFSDFEFVSAHTQPMSVGQDSSDKMSYFASEGAATKVALDFDYSKLLLLKQGGPEGREIAAINKLGQVKIYSFNKKRDLTEEEVNERWIDLKGNKNVFKPTEPESKTPFDFDMKRIPENINDIHNRWQDLPTRDPQNFAASEHFYALLKERVQEIAKDLEDQAKKNKKKIYVHRRKTPDVLFLGVENSNIHAREAALNLGRLFENISVLSMTSNQFNLSWNERSVRESTLFDENTIVVIVCRSGLTFPSYNAAEILEELHRRASERKSKMREEEFSATPANELSAQVVEGLKQAMTGHNMKELFVMTEQPDSEMAVVVGQNLKKGAAPSNRVFTVRGDRSFSEPAPLAVAKSHQTMTELLVYLQKKMLQENEWTKVAAGFHLTAEDLSRFDSGNKRLRSISIPALLGTNPDIKREDRRDLLKLGKSMAQDIREHGLFTGWAGLYVFLSVNLGATLFQYIVPKTIASITTTPLLVVLSTVGIVSGVFLLGLWKFRRLTFTYSILLGIPMALGLVPYYLGTGPLATQFSRFFDSVFYVWGAYWLMTLLFRYTTGRQIFARTGGNRRILIGDTPGVWEFAYVMWTKLFSSAYGHFATHADAGDAADEFLHYKAHTAAPGTFVMVGGPDGRRNSAALHQRDAGHKMALDQTRFTTSLIRMGTGPQSIYISHNPDKGGFHHQIVLHSDKDEIDLDNKVPHAEEVNNFIERRFDALERLLANYVLFGEVKRRVASRLWFWPDNTQSFAGIFTTPGPLPPIELVDEYKSRDLVQVAQALRHESSQKANTLWVPSGAGGLFTALLYDPGQLPVANRAVFKKKDSTGPPPLRTQAPVQKQSWNFIRSTINIFKYMILSSLVISVLYFGWTPLLKGYKSLSSFKITNNPPVPVPAQAVIPTNPQNPQQEIVALQTRITELETQKLNILGERLPRLKAAEQRLEKMTNQIAALKLSVEKNLQLHAQAILKENLLQLERNVRSLERIGTIEDLNVQLGNINRTIKWRIEQAQGQPDGYIDLLNNFGAVHQMGYDMFIPNDSKKYTGLTEAQISEVRPLAEFSDDELRSYGVTVNRKKSVGFYVPIEGGSPGATVPVTEQKGLVLAVQNASGQNRLLFVELGLKGWPIYIKQRQLQKNKLDTLRPQLEAVQQKTAGLDLSSIPSPSSIQQQLEKDRLELQKLESALPNLIREKNLIMPPDIDQTLQPFNDEIKEHQKRIEEIKKGQVGLLDGTPVVNYKLSQLDGNMKPLKTSTKNYLAHNPVNNQSSEVALFTIGDSPTDIQSELKELKEILDQDDLEVVVNVEGDDNQRRALVAEINPMTATRQRTVVIESTPDKKDRNGRTGYREILEAALKSPKGATMTASRRIVDRTYDSARLMAFVGKPERYYADEDLAEILKVLAGNGEERTLYEHGQLELIMSIVKLGKKQT